MGTAKKCLSPICVFRYFLTAAGLYDRFVGYLPLKAMGRSGNAVVLRRYLKSKDPALYVVGSFPWLSTVEGYEFWSAIDSLWYNYVMGHVSLIEITESARLQVESYPFPDPLI